MATAGKKEKYSERKIAIALESHIKEYELMEGVQLPTTAKLAEKYGVSSKTIHRAVGRLVKKGMAYRIRGSGTYVHSHGYPSEALRIGLFLWKQPSEIRVIDHAAFDYFTDDLMIKIKNQGHQIELFLENVFNKSTFHINKTPLDKFDVIVVAAGFLKVAEEKLRRFRGHVILINDDVIHTGQWHQVVYDYHAGFGKALDYLRQQGIKRIFVPGVSGMETYLRRYRALEEEALRIGYKRDKLTLYEGSYGSLKMILPVGRDCGKYYLEHISRDTAIISVSDYLSVGILDVFRENNVVLGRDVKLVSYDNLESRMPEHELELNFTGITHPLKEFADSTVRMLNDLIRQKDRTMYRVYIVSAQEFVSRGSA